MMDNSMIQLNNYFKQNNWDGSSVQDKNFSPNRRMYNEISLQLKGDETFQEA